MKGRSTGFTLIELMVVIAIILLLIAIFVPQIPAVMNWYRVHLSKVIMKQLQFAVDEYHRVFGEYPHESVQLTSDGRMEDTDYWKTDGYHSLYLALQGPNGAGWRPTATEPGIREFGPVPESPGFVGQHLGTTGEGRPRFECPFGRPVLYNRAHPDSKCPDISSSPYGTQLRYNPGVCRNAWQDGMRQRGADETTFGGNYFYMGTNYDNFVKHWRARLVASKVNGVYYPHNANSYTLWMAGSDERFGFWSWSDEHSGFVVDYNPESAADGLIGICDDITNF